MKNDDNEMPILKTLVEMRERLQDGAIILAKHELGSHRLYCFDERVAPLSVSIRDVRESAVRNRPLEKKLAAYNDRSGGLELLTNDLEELVQNGTSPRATTSYCLAAMVGTFFGDNGAKVFEKSGIMYVAVDRLMFVIGPTAEMQHIDHVYESAKPDIKDSIRTYTQVWSENANYGEVDKANATSECANMVTFLSVFLDRVKEPTTAPNGESVISMNTYNGITIYETRDKYVFYFPENWEGEKDPYSWWR